MYIITTDIQKDELPRCISNQSGRLEIALREITYYPNWKNISDELGNNFFTTTDRKIIIPDGYYNVCELNKEVFTPHGAELDLHAPSGYLRIKSTKSIELSERLAHTLGFPKKLIAPGIMVIGNRHPRLAIHKALYIHLSQISTTDNFYNGLPSTLLQSIPVENERCGGGRTTTLTSPQYKRLSHGDLPRLTLSIVDENHNPVSIDYLNITLHIRYG